LALTKRGIREVSFLYPKAAKVRIQLFRHCQG
jgi:hypothetical protein